MTASRTARKRAAPWSGLLLGLALLASAGAPARGSDADVPDNLVLDVRLFEARSTRPDFQAMEGLTFFVDTDGQGVTEQQWLATLARKIPDSFLTTLARDVVSVEGTTAHFEIPKRQRSFVLDIDLGNFLDRGTFTSSTRVELVRSGSRLQESEREIELRVGQTYVWSGRELEISASDYVSHFRDYEDAGDRADLYGKLRDYTFFLVLAVTPRLATNGEASPVEVRVEESLVPRLESPFGIPIFGELVLELVVDENGDTAEVHILRSSIPEVNPRILGEASLWRFPEAAGKRAILELSLRAEP